MESKTLVVSLIKDDLINSSMVYGLNRMGLNADHYLLHLSNTVFELMGFEDSERSDAVFEQYLELCKRAVFIDISKSHEPLDMLALEIYMGLLGMVG